MAHRQGIGGRWSLVRRLPPVWTGWRPAPGRSESARSSSVTTAHRPAFGTVAGLCCLAPARLQRRGFTLIELLVVMILIVIVIGTVGLGLGGGNVRAVQQEAARLALLVRTARQDAILEGEVYAVALTAGGYRFLVLNNQKRRFEAVRANEILRPRRLPANMHILSVTINGAAGGDRPELILLPTGELPKFDIVLGRSGVNWSVQGTAGGTIRMVRQHA